MPEFLPFPGLRYDSGRVSLDAVIAPPYDVVDAAERAALAARHRANAVLLELPEDDRPSGRDRYAQAAHLLAEWTDDGLLRRDPAPSLYAYRMRTPDGRATTGVLGALGLDQGPRGVLPHEQTLPKPKSDRLDLLRATRANLSPIWGLSMADGLSDLLPSDRAPDAAAVDDDGVVHELWVVDDDATVGAIGATVASAPVVLADGHHRFETALAYHAEVPGDASATVLALVVELSERELSVGPIHRVLSGLPEGIDLVDAFASWFDVTRVGDLDERTVGALDQGALALVAPAGIWLLTARDGTLEAAGSDLDTSQVALVLAELPEHELEFRYSVGAAVDAVTSGQAQAAILIRPVTVDQIRSWASAGRRMPPKSTYFYPKPRTGMVFRTLDP